jgi:hypothetical protein
VIDEGVDEFVWVSINVHVEAGGDIVLEKLHQYLMQNILLKLHG